MAAAAACSKSLPRNPHRRASNPAGFDDRKGCVQKLLTLNTDEDRIAANNRMEPTMKRAAMYLRVSTREQSTEMQRAALTAVAERGGWQIVEVYEDAGFSGAKGRDQRPAFDRMLKDATRRRFDVVMAWALDRLGRSLQHLVPTLAELKAAGVDLYLQQQAIDTTTPSGRAFYGMLAVFAEFERDMIAARVQAGVDRARAAGKRLGRPATDAKTAASIRVALAAGLSIRQTAAAHRVGVSTVQRLKTAA